MRSRPQLWPMSRALRKNQASNRRTLLLPYPSVNHSWIFSVIEKTELPDFINRFLRNIFNDSTTCVERDNSLWRGCKTRLSNERFFLLQWLFDPIFRWLPETVIPRNPHNVDFLQPVPCVYADDFAVAASSFRDLMTALAPAFHPLDHIAGLNLNHRKCCEKISSNAF